MMWVKWKLVLVCLEIVLIWVEDRCIPQAQKSFWTHMMVLLGDKAQVKARFGPFGESANLDRRYVHGLRRTYHRLGHRFGRTQWNS